MTDSPAPQTSQKQVSDTRPSTPSKRGHHMPKRTSPKDAAKVETVDALEEIVHDKRADWRATGAKARRRQRRYKNRLTDELVRLADQESVDAFD